MRVAYLLNQLLIGTEWKSSKLLRITQPVLVKVRDCLAGPAFLVYYGPAFLQRHLLQNVREATSLA